MAANPMTSIAAVKAGLDAMLALLNVGSIGGTIEIFSGSMPASCGTADSGTKLATLHFSTVSFSSSTTNLTGYANATANTILPDTNATGSNSVTAGYFRAKSSTPAVVLQGTVGTSSADMVLNSTSIVPGAQVSITSYTVSLPDGSGVD